MRDLKIAIMSKGRAGRITSLALFPSAVLVVPANDAASYEREHPDRTVVAQPKTVRGLAASRQWTMETFGDVFMVDDDMDRLLDWTVSKGQSPRVPHHMVESVIRRTHDMAYQVGAYIWGFGSATAPMEYSEHRPLRRSGWINCAAVGILDGGNGLWFRPDLSLVDDYWLSALNAHMHRHSLIEDRYHLNQIGTGESSGGLSEERTLAKIRSQRAELIVAFGPEVIGRKHNNWRRHSDTGHTEQTALSLPF